jgi:hypothetical protein
MATSARSGIIGLEKMESIGSRIALDSQVAYYENGANDGTDVGQDGCLARKNEGMVTRDRGLLRKGEGQPRVYEGRPRRN